MSNSEIFDISPPVDESSAVWPGDVPFGRSWSAKIKDGSNLDLSSIVTTVHIGAHADAPSHFLQDGLTVDRLALEPYWGVCQVIEVKGVKQIQWEDVCNQIVVPCERLLIATSSFPHDGIFHKDFSYISPKLILELSKIGCKLIGIDTPSFDAFDSKELPAHKALGSTGIRNLEGLNLKGIVCGYYELVALPLALVGSDASPVRAVLKRLKSNH